MDEFAFNNFGATLCNLSMLSTTSKKVSEGFLIVFLLLKSLCQNKWSRRFCAGWLVKQKSWLCFCRWIYFLIEQKNFEYWLLNLSGHIDRDHFEEYFFLKTSYNLLMPKNNISKISRLIAIRWKFSNKILKESTFLSAKFNCSRIHNELACLAILLFCVEKSFLDLAECPVESYHLS